MVGLARSFLSALAMGFAIDDQCTVQYMIGSKILATFIFCFRQRIMRLHRRERPEIYLSSSYLNQSFFQIGEITKEVSPPLNRISE
jgi:hypothetical protein